MSSLRCPKCGRRSPSGKRYCGDCGFSLEVSQTEDRETKDYERESWAETLVRPSPAARSQLYGKFVAVSLLFVVAGAIVCGAYYFTRPQGPGTPIITTPTSSAAEATQELYTVTVQMAGVPSGLASRIFVDGSYNGDIASESPRTFPFGIGTTHTITVDTYLSASEDTRYVTNEPSKKISGSWLMIFAYHTQYRVVVSCSKGSCPQFSANTDNHDDRGWYDSGTVLVIEGQFTPERGWCPSSEDYWNWYVNGVRVTRERRTGDLPPTLTLNVDRPLSVEFWLEQSGELLC